MKIAVMGSGGVGGYFGGRLAAAGEDVWFIARGQHLAEMRRTGLRVKSRLGDLHLSPTQSTDQPAQIGPVDLVIFTVKLWDTDSAAAAVKPLIGANTTIVSFQNGVDAAERLSAVLGKEHVIGGVCHIAATIAGPGVIRHTGTMARLTVGEIDGGTSARVEAIAAACKAAGIDVVVSPGINRAIWEKFVFLASFSGVTALTRLPKGPIMDDPDTRELFRTAIGEAVAVAQVRGTNLPQDIVETLMAFADGLPAEMKSSMLVDLERGARLELPWLSGMVAKLGTAAGVPTPVHRTIYQALKLHVDGRNTCVTPV